MMKSIWEQSKALPYFKTRVMLACLFMPLGPWLVLSVADLGRQMGEQVAEYLVAQGDPWILIFLAAGFPALIIGLIVRLFTSHKETCLNE